METDAFTPNLIELSSFVILKTGTPAGVWALVNCVPTLTLGAVCCAVCATARMQKASIVSPAKKMAFFIVILHLKICVIREPLPVTCQSHFKCVVDMPIYTCNDACGTVALDRSGEVCEIALRTN